MKILPVAVELFHLDGRVDARTKMTQLIAAFRNFTKAPNERIEKWNCKRIQNNNISFL